MADKKQLAVSAVAATSLLLAGATPGLGGDERVFGAAQLATESAVQSNQSAGAFVKADASEGQFAWDQTTITPNSVIKEVFRAATSALCNATNDLAVDNPLQWRLAVSGDVDNAFTATVDELAQEQAVQQTMTCSCGGNPSDGQGHHHGRGQGHSGELSGRASRCAQRRQHHHVRFVRRHGSGHARWPMSLAITA